MYYYLIAHQICFDYVIPKSDPYSRKSYSTPTFSAPTPSHVTSNIQPATRITFVSPPSTVVPHHFSPSDMPSQPSTQVPDILFL